jgi:hypothetical protein
MSMPEEKGATGSRSASPKAKSANTKAHKTKTKAKAKASKAHKTKAKAANKANAGPSKSDALAQKKGKRDLTREEFDAREAEVRKALLDAQFALIEGKPKAVLVLVNGLSGSGRGETVNLLGEKKRTSFPIRSDSCATFHAADRSAFSSRVGTRSFLRPPPRAKRSTFPTHSTSKRCSWKTVSTS